MANFTLETFVSPVTSEDNNIQIRDKFGKIRYTIIPLQIAAVFASSNLVKVQKKASSDIILLDFRSNEEAKKALIELQTQIDIARKADPIFVEPGVSVSFIYHQVVATNSWGTISHTLGYKPNVTITDDSFVEIEGLVQYIDDSHFIVKFNQDLTGWIISS